MGCTTSRNLIVPNPQGFQESDENESAHVRSPSGEAISGEMRDPDRSLWNEDDGHEDGQASSQILTENVSREIIKRLQAEVATPPAEVAAEEAEEVIAGASNTEGAARSPRLTPAMAKDLGKMEQALEEAAAADMDGGDGIVTKEKEGAVAMYVPSGADVNAAAILPACVQRRTAKPNWKTADEIDEKLMIASAFRQESLNKRKELASGYEKRRSIVLRRRELVSLLGPDGAMLMTSTETGHTSAMGSPKASAMGSPKASTMGSPKASAMGSPKASAMGSPKASAMGSPKASAMESPKASCKTRTKTTTEEGAKGCQPDSDDSDE